MQWLDVRDCNYFSFIRNVGTANRSQIPLILASQLHPFLPPM